ncbi:uncharacterized protein LOC135502545 isoform X2 [Lineus longissimus]|uniref:uncharacterized protein LOC135502545 isoform X2 n=1 Tax=Lineus longissimus TaxID=88925 RepID=UPI00315C7CA8
MPTMKCLVLELVSGKKGKMLWKFDTQPGKDSIMNVYTSQPIKDYDGDGVPEVLVLHGGDPIRAPGSKEERFGRLMIFSGKDGNVLRWETVPDGHESYYSPQLHTLRDGSEVVLFGTGGETHGGSFWYVLLDDLYKGDLKTKARSILHDDFKGFMTPPALVDLNRDGVEDIIIVAFNSTVIALDGQTFKTMWKYHVPSSESYNTPAVGYFNDDDIPDFMVHFSIGPGFPIYYYSETFVLDGKTGQPLTDPVKDSVGAQSSPLAISVEGHGNDIFLYWIADCKGHEGQGGEYYFLNGTNVHEQSRSDFCKLRFKSEGYSQYKAINRHMQLPGKDVYNSAERSVVERASWVNTTEEGLQFIQRHPQYLDDYVKSQTDADEDEKQKPYFKVMNPKHQDPDYDDEFSSVKDLLKGIMDREGDRRPTQSNIGLGTSPPGGGQRRYMNTEAGRNPLSSISPGISRPLKENNNNWRRRPINRHPPIGSIQKRSLNSASAYKDDVSEHAKEALDANSMPYIQKPKTEEEKKESLRLFAERMDKLREQLASTEPISEEDLMEYNNAQKGKYSYASARWGVDDGNSARLNKKHRNKVKNHRKNNGVQDIEESEELIDDVDNKNINSAKQSRRKNRKNRRRKKLRKHRRGKNNRHRDSRTLSDSDVDEHRKHKRHAGVREEVLDIEIRDNIDEFLDGEQTKMEAQMRKKRHVGPHDQEGLQRLLSTGTIAPTLLDTNHPDYHQSVDVIFATYWFFPAKTQTLLPKDKKCVEEFMKQETIRFSPKSKYYGMDHDAYGHAAVHECLEKSDHKLPDNGTYESQTSFNPFNVHMGQMTIYRIRLVCTCKGDKKIEKQYTRCSRILPHDQQQWSGYMGSYGNSHWKPRREQPNAGVR